MKALLLLISLFLSLNIFASTADVLQSEYPAYYNQGVDKYELYYCHKNAAHLLNHLRNFGAVIDEITVVIIQDIESRNNFNPSYTRFDNEFEWHVVLLYDGVIYDQNILYGEKGMLIENYFELMLGDVDLNDIIIRTVSGKIFHRFFYNDEGHYKGYIPHEFIERFLRGEEFPLEKAQYLKWY
ncbi:MAG: hypothetical protein KAG61_02085 [Bacteriovoracaceae bacterium]|nr:hypothetical protein [Bacteriovoracaceae bacterium]